VRFFFIITLFAFLHRPSFGQDDSVFQLIKTYPVQAVDIAIDNLDNMYLVTETDQLKKYTANGDSVAVFNGVKRFGKLHSVEVSNPLKILLFYKDFSTIVILDRLLAVRATIDLKRYQILQASAISLSYDNHIWVFDEYNNRLKKINEEGNVLLETPDFRQLFNLPFLPQQIIDNNNLVHVYDPQNGLLIFDHFGTLKRKVERKGWNYIAVKDNFILGVSNTTFDRYNTTNLFEATYTFPQHFLPYYRYSLLNNKLVALSKDSLSIFSYRY
jgi:hypothetical protein